MFPKMQPANVIKCSKCGWVHYWVDSNGRDKCFRCNALKDKMVKVNFKDVPIGATIHPINRPDSGGNHET